jgi:hypothetical protein
MTERRYDENETAEIFARAAEARPAPSRALPAGEGMTLAELQEIGRQAGMSIEQVAEAARSLDRPAQPAPVKLLGLEIGVGRTVQLDRRLSDAEWERLVVLLRDTFQARGALRTDGSLRQWTNGNLQVLVEPSGSGERVRLRTRNANAQGFIIAGAGIVGFTGFMSVLGALTGTLYETGYLQTLLPIAATGLATLGIGLARLRGWARTRQEQMDGIAARLESGDPL